MFGELLAQLHLLRAMPDPALHLVQQVLVGPAGDTAAPRIAGAAGLEAAAGAGGCGVVPALASLLGGLPAEGELFSGRAVVAVILGIVAEVFFAEEAQGGVGGGVGFRGGGGG